jgi:tetratricopeptide (TPR) repeat protein
MTPATQRFLFRDSLAVVSLTAITVVLFAVTLFLFRSFEGRRASLAKYWANQGLAALRTNQPVQAVTAYRTALSYAPGERNDELMLAQALGEAGRIDESFNYFTSLWGSQPGDGLINLELARLAAKQQSPQEAINFYRAAIYGTWEGDAIERRRTARLELARYLIQQKHLVQAKTELLVAGGNAPDIPDLDMTLGGLLEQTNDPSDAQ